MKYLILFISLLTSLFANSQQVIKMCEENKTTFTYYAFAGLNGVYNWKVDGITQPNGGSDELTINWNDLPLGIHTIEVIYVSDEGCESDPEFFTVSTLECDNSTLYAPNAFTPDADEFNNTWIPIGYNWTEIHYMIYDRWGELIFESYDGNVGWDGTYNGQLCKSDVYIYVIDWKDNLNRRHKNYGHITLLR
jgi:gliding motility-associated-like protein